MRILVVDDDHAVRDSLRRALRLEGYDVDLAAGGAEALDRFGQDSVEPDAVILDVLMPGLDGIDTCKAIRRASDVPILMLTARDAIDDRVEGLDAGADDYLVKPFVVKELFARLRALLRRSTGAEAGMLTFADVELNMQTREVSRGGAPIALTRTEFALLELFMARPNRVLSRDAIFETVWGYDMSYASNSLEVFVGYLRRKLEADGRPRLIRTVRGLGYMLRET